MSRCYDCGRATVTGGGVVGIRRTDAGLVGLAGLSTCGRVWLCPVCNAKVMARRAVEIGAALTWAAVEGLHVIWGSLTVHHTSSSPLGHLIGVQQDAWRHVVQGRTWTRASATATRAHVCSQTCESSCERKRDTYDTGKDGRVGYIRASEITTGANGWHPHFHPIILWRGTAADAQAFADQVVSRWCDGVQKAGGYASEHGGAQQLRVIGGVEIYDELARYVTKATYDPNRMALETVWSQGKTGRGRAKETVSHWSLLAAVEQGLAVEIGQWSELEEATNGHRMITWSRGLRGFAGLGVEVEDDEIVAEEVGTKDDTVAVLTTEGWRMVRDRPDILAMMLDQLESAGMAGLVNVLNLYGVPWLTVDDLSDVSHPAHRAFYDDLVDETS